MLQLELEWLSALLKFYTASLTVTPSGTASLTGSVRVGVASADSPESEPPARRPSQTRTPQPDSEARPGRRAAGGGRPSESESRPGSDSDDSESDRRRQRRKAALSLWGNASWSDT